MSIALTTPAQKLRGLATRTRLLTGSPPERARARPRAERRERAWLRAQSAGLPPARRGTPCATSAPVRAPVGQGGARQPPHRLLGRVGDRPDDAGQATGRGQRRALGVHGHGAGLAGELTARHGIVHDDARVADHGGQRSRHLERLLLPEHRPLGVDDAPRADERAGRKPGDERAGEAEGDEPPFRQRQPGLEPDAGRARLRTPRRGLLDGEGAREGERPGGLPQRNVQARLLTVSFTLEVVAIVAAGSKPEWIPQCSQRWSFPGP